MSFGLAPFGSAPYGALGDDTQSLAETLSIAAIMAANIDVKRIDGLLIGSVLVPEFFVNIVNNSVWSDATTSDVVYAVIDALQAADAHELWALYRAAMTDTLLAKSVPTVLWDVSLTDTTDITELTVADILRTVALLDAMVAAGIVETRYTGTVALSEALAVAGAALVVHDGFITDAAGVSALLADSVVRIAALIDSVIAQADALGLAIVTVQLQDGMSVEGTVLTQTLFYGLLEEHLDFTVNLALDGLPYLGVCMNATNKAITEYQPYDFNSLAVLQGVLYGANDAGLFRLDGDTDDAVSIDAYARTALTRIADGRMSQVDSAYLGYSSDGVIQLKAITTDATGAKTSRVYQLNAQIADANRSGRIKLGRGVKSVYWAFEVSNSLGADFTIDVLELRVLALSRRI